MKSSWVPVAATSHFPLNNLPFGVFSVPPMRPKIGVAIGEYVLDLSVVETAGLFKSLQFDTSVFHEETLNKFMELNRTSWRATRSRIMELLALDTPDTSLKDNEALKSIALVPISDVKMHLPCTIGDYTDFYSSREHATNVGIMFRGKENALQPNWLHLPVGYHGRASSVVLSGTDVVRPSGQLQADKDDASKGSVYGSCKLLDFELEMAFFVGGKSNEMGRPLTIAEAEDRIFGIVLMNDWSARDIQAWEYVPLGPFTAKNFATSISPWIVMLDALEEFKCSTSAVEQVEPLPLPYLQDPAYTTSSYNVNLEIGLLPDGEQSTSIISRSNLKYMYWNMKQQLVHHSVTGCPMNAGDLLGTGTISGPEVGNLGSMLELSWRGSREIVLENSFVNVSTDAGTVRKNDVRKFLKDGDTVTMTGYAEGNGYRIGFGEVSGKVLPAGSPRPPVCENAVSNYNNFKLYNYWRSSSSYRVRIAMGLKGLDFEYIPIDLMKLVGNTTEKLPLEYTNMNNMEQVPLLQFTVGGTSTVHQLTQSLPIIEFLDEITGGPRLLPTDPYLKAKVREIAEVINSGIQPLHNIRNLRQIKSVVLIGSDATVDANGMAKDAIERGLKTLESLVSGPSAQGSKFAVGTTYPTLADVSIVPQLYAAKRFGVDVAAYPSLSRINELCNSLPAFQKAAPEVQIDAKL